MADPKDVMDVLNLIQDVGVAAAQIRAHGTANVFQDFQLLSALWAPIQAVIGDAPTALVDVPAELGALDAQGIADVWLKMQAIYKAWAAVFAAPVAPAHPTTPAA